VGSLRIPTDEGTRPFVVLADVWFQGSDPYAGGAMHAELHGDGLDVSGGMFIFGFDGIDESFQDIATNWRGWDGAKTWRSPETHLTIDATALRSGHRRLRFTLRDDTLPTWSAWVEVDVEGGEEMSRLAADIVALVAAGTKRP
jgi:hypothetical protein